MADPVITVLMPVYNGGEYLRFSIASILSQTYRDFELLIINDSSTDNSLDVIRSFKDPRIVVHSNPENLGQTKSLNIGLRLAKSKYIAINDADDLSLPRRLEKQIDFMAKNPGVTVVGTSALIMNRSGRVKRPFFKPTDVREIVLSILSDTPVIHGSVLMKKETILSQGGYNEEFRICQDYELWSSLIRNGFKIANIPDKMVVIRHYMDSISFKENDAQTLESGKIIYANVMGMTGLKITLDDAIKQRMFFAAPERLSKEGFKRMEELFVNEYRSFMNGPSDARFNLRSLKGRILKPFSKLAISEAKRGNLKEARAIARKYLKRYGLKFIPFIIYITSYTSKGMLEMVLSLYEKGQELSIKVY